MFHWWMRHGFNQVKTLASCGLTVMLSVSLTQGEDWPQFRGLHGTGVSRSSSKLPVEVAPDSLVIWKKQVSAGHSSPIISGDRIFLTAATADTLSTIALDRATGAFLWESTAPYDELEPIHQTGSRAQATPAADAEVVIAFFGSSGLFAYGRGGKLLWSHRMGPFKNDFGAGSSPIIEGDLVILVQDHDVDSFIAVYHKRTGEPLWRVERPEVTRNYATPVIWDVGGKKQIVVSATLRIVGYDLMTGEEAWEVNGASRIVNMTPVVGPDKTLYVACFSPGNDGEDRVPPPSLDELFANDADKNGTIEEIEFPSGPFKGRFTQMDRNKDTHLTREEFLAVIRTHTDGKNSLMAIAPGGKGDITKTHVLWSQSKQLPYCPSPLYYDGRIYLIKNGGIFSAIDAKTGKVLRHARLKATGDYYASPVAGDGKIYLLSQKGEMTVVAANPGWDEMHTVNFDGDGHATPAIADGRLYVRVGDNLYCFGLDDH